METWQVFIFLMDPWALKGKLQVLPLKLLVYSSPFPLKLFPDGTTSSGSDFTSCHLSYVFLEVGKFFLAVVVPCHRPLLHFL